MVRLITAPAPNRRRVADITDVETAAGFAGTASTPLFVLANHHRLAGIR